MKYKLGDEVVLKETWGKLSILEVDSDISGYLLTEFGWINEVDIDHDKTAELHKKDKTLNHYTNESEKIVAEKNKVDIPVVDTVNHPPHYTQGDIEVIDIIEVLTNGYTGYEGNLVGNVIKYLARANFKGNKVKDIQKSQFYLNKLVEELEK